MKTLKHLFTAVLLLCGIIANAHDFEVNGIYYKITDSTNQYVSVTFQGASHSEVAGEYSGDVVIPESVTYNDVTYSVTAVAESAFRNCSDMTSLTIPATVISVGNYAFNGCSSLAELYFEDGENTLTLGYQAYNNSSESYYGKGLFYDCPLETLYIGRTLSYQATQYYGYSPFYNRTKLNSVTIGNNVTKIPESAFQNCSNITSITIPASVTVIGNFAFNQCSSLKEIYFEDGDATLKLGYYSYSSTEGYGLFYSCPLETLYLGRTLSYDTSLRYGSTPFKNKSTLSSVTIGNKVTSIGTYLFEGCSGITSITIPSSVTSIGVQAFDDCTALKEVVIEDGVTTLSLGYNLYNTNSYGGEGLFYDCPLETLYLGRNISYSTGQSYGYSPFYYNRNLTSVTISNSVTIIPESAFHNCSSITSITIPNSVTRIKNNAFYGCNSLKDLNIEDGNSTLTLGYTNPSTGVNDYCLFTSCPLETLYLGRNLSYDTSSDYEYSPFYHKVKLYSVTIGDNVTALSDYLFTDCSALASITMPNSVTTIGNYAFNNCAALTSIEISENLTSIGNSAFYGCSALTSIEIFENLTSIGSSAFYGCSALTSIEIPESVTSIGSSAFYGCSSATEINIPNGVTAINEYTFYGCSNLVALNPPATVETIGNYAFCGCKTLTSITIPSSVTNVGNFAFDNCTSLKEVVIEDSENSLSLGYNLYSGTGEGLFQDCPLETLYLGRNISYSAGQSYGYSPFYNKDKITSIALSNNVTKINGNQFYGCKGIASIIIPNKVTSIDTSAFFGCNNLAAVVNLSTLTFTKGSSSNGYVAYYAENVINAPNGTIEGDFVFAEIDDVNTLVGYIKSSNTTERFNNLRLDPQLELEKFTFNANAGDSIIFDWDISDGAVSDRLTVSIDGQSIFTKAGKGNGTHKYVLTTDGTHTFTATYDAYLNTWAYVRNIKLIHTTVPTVDVTLPDSYKGKSYVIAENVFEERWDITGLEIPSAVKAIGENAFKGCRNLTSITSYIKADDLYAINPNVFEGVDKNECKLYVPTGDDMIYALTDGWKEFYNIEEVYTPSEVTITISQYGSATYCSTYALDFSNVEGLKAYTAAGYNKYTQVVTLLRVQSAERATGLFLKGAPGEYTVPVIEESGDYTLNMLVGTIRSTTVNSKSNDGEYHNFKYTVIGDSNTPEFYQFEDGSTLGANKAYLQLPASLFPAAAKSIRARFDEGAFTDIEEITTGNKEGVYYDLQGRAVENPTNGIYIINGKKVIVNK